MGNGKTSCPQRLNNIETFGEARQWQFRAHSRRSRQRVERATIVLALRGRLHDGDPMESERLLNFAVLGHQRIRFLAPRFGGKRKPRIVDMHVAIAGACRYCGHFLNG